MDSETMRFIVAAVTPAAAGLLGVAVGGWITGRHQLREREHNRAREQLERFYSPLLGLRARILAKSEFRVRVGGAANAAWRRLVGGLPPHQAIRVSEERSPDFQRIIDEDNRQLVEELLPLYRQMVEHFASNMWLAESSTREHFGALVEFVETWDRWLRGALPPEVLAELGHSEEIVKPLYRDFAEQMDRLRAELRR